MHAVRVTHNIFHITRPQLVPREGRTSFDSNLASSQGSATSYISNVMASTIKPQFSGSPPSKLASLQEFVQHQWDASEMGCSRWLLHQDFPFVAFTWLFKVHCLGTVQ